MYRLLVLLLAFGSPLCQAGDYAVYENAIRAAMRMHNLRDESCRSAANRGLCYAKADAEWQTAMALAKASYIDTKTEWAAAQSVIASANARVARITSGTNHVR